MIREREFIIRQRLSSQHHSAEGTVFDQMAEGFGGLVVQDEQERVLFGQPRGRGRWQSSWRACPTGKDADRGVFR
jgi:hypothetical protein